ncbi:DUF433 domain-containing protein [Nocardia sp. NPDC058658]|uniref:DUF433 domain-containing protein n=1 Tax=Nocardia sp. NPDC058658 TaxID=3346580 RepID=UPI00365F01D4
MFHHARITFDPDQLGGRPCIRGMRISVADVLELLAEGESEDAILEAFPYLEREDIRACLTFAAVEVDRPRPADRISGQFRMPIQNVFTVNGTVVVSGRVDSGVVHTGDEIEIVGDGGSIAATVAWVDFLCWRGDGDPYARAGDNTSLRLKRVRPGQLRIGWIATGVARQDDTVSGAPLDDMQRLRRVEAAQRFFERGQRGDFDNASAAHRDAKAARKRAFES